MHTDFCEQLTFIATENVISPERLKCTSTLIVQLKKIKKNTNQLLIFNFRLSLFKKFPVLLNFFIFSFHVVFMYIEGVDDRQKRK